MCCQTPSAVLTMARTATARASQTVAVAGRTASATTATLMTPSVIHGASCQALCQWRS